MYLTDYYINGKKEKGHIINEDISLYFDFEGKSDNQCEWLSLYELFRYISGYDASNEIDVYTDSKLVCDQLQGNKRIKSKSLKPIYLTWNRFKK